MLKKLLKYEFKATARTYGGMYLALLAASVLFGGSVGDGTAPIVTPIRLSWAC